MRREIESINHILHNAPAGGHLNDGRKTIAIREWISRILSKIIEYKARHRGLFNALEASLMHLELPDVIVRNNVLPFLELPSHTFDREDITVVINPKVIGKIDEGGNKDEWVRCFFIPLVFTLIATALTFGTYYIEAIIFVVMVVFHSENSRNLRV